MKILKNPFTERNFAIKSWSWLKQLKICYFWDGRIGSSGDDFTLGFEIDLVADVVDFDSDLDLVVQSRIAEAGRVRSSESMVKSSPSGVVNIFGCGVGLMLSQPIGASPFEAAPHDWV